MVDVPPSKELPLKQSINPLAATDSLDVSRSGVVDGIASRAVDTCLRELAQLDEPLTFFVSTFPLSGSLDAGNVAHSHLEGTCQVSRNPEDAPRYSITLGVPWPADTALLFDFIVVRLSSILLTPASTVRTIRLALPVFRWAIANGPTTPMLHDSVYDTLWPGCIDIVPQEIQRCRQFHTAQGARGAREGSAWSADEWAAWRSWRAAPQASASSERRVTRSWTQEEWDEWNNPGQQQRSRPRYEL